MAHVRRATADESPSESPPPLDQFAGARPSIPPPRVQPAVLELRLLVVVAAQHPACRQTDVMELAA